MTSEYCQWRPVLRLLSTVYFRLSRFGRWMHLTQSGFRQQERCWWRSVFFYWARMRGIGMLLARMKGLCSVGHSQAVSELVSVHSSLARNLYGHRQCLSIYASGIQKEGQRCGSWWQYFCCAAEADAWRTITTTQRCWWKEVISQQQWKQPRYGAKKPLKLLML